MIFMILIMKNMIKVQNDNLYIDHPIMWNPIIWSILYGSYHIYHVIKLQGANRRAGS